ncbi:MAG: uroporphyrinogen-III synthase [Pseudomonadota bacterium]|nr:uroporphyrinogen-III synthase [Pseudomonadota bacterium]
MISLRPRGEHQSLRHAAARQGGGLIALSPWALRDRHDEGAREALSRALVASRVLFTSPAAVRAADRLLPLRAAAGHGYCWLGVGTGTRSALLRLGLADAICPPRMDSEGLLAMPQLQDVHGVRIGLVTAPGGRGALTPAMEARGAVVVRADVYERVPVPLPAEPLRVFRALSRPAVLAVSSGEALQRVLQAAPEDIARQLRSLPAVVASERLALQARQSGFPRVGVSRSASPADLVAAAIEMTGPERGGRDGA